jgi:hypothetical protein
MNLNFEKIKKGDYILKYRIIESKMNNEDKRKKILIYLGIILSIILFYSVVNMFLKFKNEYYFLIFILFIILYFYKLVTETFLDFKIIGQIEFYENEVIINNKNTSNTIKYSEIRKITSKPGIPIRIEGRTHNGYKKLADFKSLIVCFEKDENNVNEYHIHQEMFLIDNERKNHKIQVPTLEKILIKIYPDYKIVDTHRNEYKYE